MSKFSKETIEKIRMAQLGKPRPQTTGEKNGHWKGGEATWKERKFAYEKKYRTLHKKELSKKRKQTHILNKNKPDYLLSRSLRLKVNKVLGRKSNRDSSINLLGCSINQLKFYLESKFTDGMTWENHSQYGWHIDHIFPLSSFDLTDDMQVKKAFHYTNLQPLWANDNLSKADKVPTIVASNIISSPDAILGMVIGIERVANVLRKTYGGAGCNVIVQTKLRPFSMVVNDAETIVQAMEFTNPAEKRGLGFIKELCEKQEKVAGNGRKTAILIAIEIINQAIKSKTNKLQLKRDLDALIPVIESEIDLLTKQITVDEVYGVAKTASESGETGHLLQEIYQKIGKNGLISIEGSGTYDTSYKITSGVKFEMTGVLSSEMVHDEEAIKDKRKETKAVYEHPWILITKKKITTDEDINPLLKEMREAGKKDLVIFTNDMDSGVASLLVNLHRSKEFNICIIKAPTLWQNYVFEDFAKCTGATIIEDATGKTFKNMNLNDLGTCGRIEVDQEDTILTGIQDITDHLNTLKAKGDDDSKLRLSWLATDTAMLKLGANSQTDLSYKRLKANDANRSTYLALQYGVVQGGGLCLYDISTRLPNTEAGNILCKALQAPLEQAMSNYGLGHVEYQQLITEDIVDASMVVKRAVRNAVGIASTILTSDAIVYIPELTPTEISYQIAMRQSNPFNQ